MPRKDRTEGPRTRAESPEAHAALVELARILGRIAAREAFDEAQKARAQPRNNSGNPGSE